MPKTRRDRSVSFESSELPSFACSSLSSANQSPSSSSPATKEALKEWEQARCPVCIEHPHNAILLICSSYEKGCRPYMCDTSYRHSNCFDQFCKSFSETPLPAPSLETTEHLVEPDPLITSETSITSDQVHVSLEEMSKGPLAAIGLPNVRKLHEKLLCPLCRGQIWGCTIVESARTFMNSKTRNCACETCGFSGDYTGLRKHARLEHPLVRPSQADPERQRSWRRLERQRDIADVLSTIQSSFGEDQDDNTILPIEESSLLTVFLLIRVFQPGTGSRSSGRSGISRPRARFGIRTRTIRIRSENNDEETASSSTVLDQNEILSLVGGQRNGGDNNAVGNDVHEADAAPADDHSSLSENSGSWIRQVRRRTTRDDHP